MTRARTILTAALSAAALAAVAQPAAAATLTVDDDKVQCAGAGYTTLASAVDNATTDDTIVVCDGTYTEGTGAVGTNAVTIDKSLTIKGAGASKVIIQPATAGAGRIANNPVGGAVPLRNGVGSVIGVGLASGSTIRTNVSISGVTVRANGVIAEAGIAFYNSSGSVANTRVTGMTTAPGSNPGTGWGITHVTNQQLEPQPAADISSRVPRTLTVSTSRIEGYGQGGVLVDGATDATPTTRSNTINALTMSSTEIVGAGPVASTTFGQIGLQASYGARAVVSGSSIRDNINSTDPTLAYGVLLRDSDNSLVPQSTTSTQTRFSTSNIQNNSRGLFNLNAAGAANETAPVLAEGNWWGVNTGPAVDPATQVLPGNPVSGPATGGSTGSGSVDYVAFRTTAAAVATQPVTAADAAPSITVSAAPTTVAPGETVRIVAKPTDDLGVKSVDFLQDGTPVATLTAAPYAIDYTPGTADIGTRTFTALVTDSSGQTASATVTVTVAEPPAAAGVDGGEGQGGGAAPTGSTITPASVTGPSLGALTLPGRIASTGSLITVNPSAPAGVREVSFAIGSRVVCRVTAAPFRCRLLPTGADVGRRLVSVTVTDVLGGRSVTSRMVTFGRFTPTTTLGVSPKRDKAGPFAYRLSGRVKRPARVTAAQACRGKVRLVLRAGKRVLASRTVKLSKRCRYTGKLTVTAAKLKGATKLTGSATFTGNSVLGSRAAKKAAARAR